MILQKTSDLNYHSKRIISLVPSQTELLFDLGLEAETIGITKFCIHPSAWYKTKEKVGGTKTLQLNKIRNLKPDLIIANKEENVKDQIEELAKDFPIWLTDVNNLEDALQMINNIGALTGKKATSLTLAGQIKQNFKKIKLLPSPMRTSYLIWQKPYMTIGGDTFIHDMLYRCGFQNVFTGQNRYPQTTVSELITKNCELLLLSSEPYPFKQKHIDELSKLLPHTKIVLVDGEFFSWYGSRLIKAPQYFKNLINYIMKLN